MNTTAQLNQTELLNIELWYKIFSLVLTEKNSVSTLKLISMFSLDLVTAMLNEPKFAINMLTRLPTKEALKYIQQIKLNSINPVGLSHNNNNAAAYSPYKVILEAFTTDNIYTIDVDCLTRAIEIAKEEESLRPATIENLEIMKLAILLNPSQISAEEKAAIKELLANPSIESELQQLPKNDETRIRKEKLLAKAKTLTEMVNLFYKLLALRSSEAAQEILNLSGANFRKMNFSYLDTDPATQEQKVLVANLSNANLKNANLEKVKPYGETALLNLTNANLENTSLFEFSLHRLILKNTIIKNCHFLPKKTLKVTPENIVATIEDAMDREYFKFLLLKLSDQPQWLRVLGIGMVQNLIKIASHFNNDSAQDENLEVKILKRVLATRIMNEVLNQPYNFSEITGLAYIKQSFFSNKKPQLLPTELLKKYVAKLEQIQAKKLAL